MEEIGPLFCEPVLMKAGQRSLKKSLRNFQKMNCIKYITKMRIGFIICKNIFSLDEVKEISDIRGLLWFGIAG